jgi:hypothetical protein
MNEIDLLRALARAIYEERVHVALDYKRLQHTDSPIAVQADHNRWLYGIAATALGVAVGWDIMRGMVALVLGIMFYAAHGRPWMHRRMRDRFYTYTLKSTHDFKQLWHLRGVVLTAVPDGHSGIPPICASPDGDWRRFVLDHLMTSEALPPADS